MNKKIGVVIAIALVLMFAAGVIITPTTHSFVTDDILPLVSADGDPPEKEDPPPCCEDPTSPPGGG